MIKLAHIRARHFVIQNSSMFVYNEDITATAFWPSKVAEASKVGPPDLLPDTCFPRAFVDPCRLVLNTHDPLAIGANSCAKSTRHPDESRTGAPPQSPPAGRFEKCRRWCQQQKPPSLAPLATIFPVNQNHSPLHMPGAFGRGGRYHPSRIRSSLGERGTFQATHQSRIEKSIEHGVILRPKSSVAAMNVFVSPSFTVRST